MNKLIFNNKNFKLMILGQIVSIQGSALLRFALSLYVLDFTGRSDLFATLFAISNIPLLLGPIGGALADRFNKKNLMVLFDFSSALLISVFYMVLSVTQPSITTIGFFMVLISIISSLYTPTVTASIPFLVTNEQLPSTNGLVQAIQALSNVIAPVIGGILYGFIEIKYIVMICAIAFLLSAIMECFILIPFEKTTFSLSIPQTLLLDLKEGLYYIRQENFILRSIVLAAILNLVLTPFFIVGGPIILRVTMSSNDFNYGLGMSLINLATIIGALCIGFVANKMTLNLLYKWFLMIALLILPIALSTSSTMLSFGFYPSFIIFVTFSILIAMLMTMISLSVITKVQIMTPNKYLGKVMAIIMAVSQSVAPLGQFIYGHIFNHSNIMSPIILLSLLMLALAVFTYKLFQNPERRVIEYE